MILTGCGFSRLLNRSLCEESNRIGVAPGTDLFHILAGFARWLVSVPNHRFRRKLIVFRDDVVSSSDAVISYQKCVVERVMVDEAPVDSEVLFIGRGNLNGSVVDEAA